MMLRKRYLLVAALLAVCSAAQTKKPVQGLFWKATSPTNTIYLLGSIHIGDKSMYPLPKPMEDAFAKSNVLVVEVNINKVDVGKVQSFMAQKGMYQGEDTLWKHLDKQTVASLKKYLSDQGLPADGFGKMRPWVITLLMPVLAMQKAGMDPNLGIDKYFLDKVKPPKRIEELETADYQMKLLASDDDAAGIKALKQALKESKSIKTGTQQMEQAWITGDSATMNQITVASFKESPETGKKLLYDRNPHMADVAEKYLKGTEPCFIVVGAGHLVGEQGVIAILKKRGYKVEQIKEAAK